MNWLPVMNPVLNYGSCLIREKDSFFLIRVGLDITTDSADRLTFLK